MKISAGPVTSPSFWYKLFRTVWPKSDNEVFVLDGKWVILFHVIVVAVLVIFHSILMNLTDF
ncbi:hypothetical protein AL01_07650 [Bombella intestini]|uniref:Uncharacterized protein n=1 Tax=Bombella intestini TaxID=1539051 RepID=A0A1S8GNZ5_9PROT|nr:hypothetical protein [Bombella intestini]OOL17825.1 hypothetical protein AL01_07650 [Bombella intestini]